MTDPSTDDPHISHRHVHVEGLSIHVAEAGTPDKPAIVFLHGWPQTWAAFAPVMATLRDEAHVLALDLPGIGGSPTPPPAGDMRTLARYVRGVIGALALHDVTLVGHDAGGRIVYAYLQDYAGEIDRAVLMNAAIPDEHDDEAARPQPIDTPVLRLRGDPDQQPAAVAAALREFIATPMHADQVRAPAARAPRPRPESPTTRAAPPTIDR